MIISVFCLYQVWIDSISFGLSGGAWGSWRLRGGFVLLFLLFLLLHDQFGVVVNVGPELSSEEGAGQNWQGAHGNEEEECGLRVFENEHGQEGFNNAVEISNKGHFEVVELNIPVF